MSKNKAELVEKRYKFNIGFLLGEIKKDLKWADGKTVKDEYDAQVTLLATQAPLNRGPQFSWPWCWFKILALLGPKTESDNVKEKKVSLSHLPGLSRSFQGQGRSRFFQKDDDKKEKKDAKPEAQVEKIQTFMDIAGAALDFHKPGEHHAS